MMKIPKISGFAKEILLVLGLSLFFVHFSAYASSLPLTDRAYEVYQEGSSIPVPKDVRKDGAQIAKDLVLGALPYVKILVGVVGIVIISILGLRMITNGSNEEDVTSSRQGIVYVIIAFAIVSMSQDLARIFDMEQATILGSPQQILNRVRLFDKEVEIFMTFVKYFIGAYATFMMVRAGAKMITAGADEEEVTKSKKALGFNAAGLMLLYAGNIFVEQVFYKVDKNVYSGITGVTPGVDAKAGVEQIAGITNFIVSFVGPIAVLILIVGGVMYASAAGQEEQTERAKRLIFATVIGLVIIYGAFALVSTVIAGQLSELQVIQP